MSSTAHHDVDQALVYPEPPAHPNWRRPGTAKPRPITLAQQEHNRELLALALRKPRTSAA
ncbi:hypothetical protein ABZ517_39300 [Streptomyces scabiei]|uniref:hypothetical protein n=1 Tax=Streptomyces scabiei TaxID=1930 RepID=UPI0033DAC40F